MQRPMPAPRDPLPLTSGQIANQAIGVVAEPEGGEGVAPSFGDLGSTLVPGRECDSDVFGGGQH